MPVQLPLVLVGCCCACTYTCVVGWHLSLAWCMRQVSACQCLGHSSSFGYQHSDTVTHYAYLEGGVQLAIQRRLSPMKFSSHQAGQSVTEPDSFSAKQPSRPQPSNFYDSKLQQDPYPT